MTLPDLVARAERVCRAVGEREALELTARMVEVPSPTGEEAALAEELVGLLAAEGLEARLQTIGAGQANAVATLRGSGQGPDLLLYAPLDTAFAGRPHEDEPWIRLSDRPDQRPSALVEDGVVRGLGANNPKGHGACAVLAVAALARSGVRLRGDVSVALCAGGMPTDQRPGAPGSRGHGLGCSFLLEHGFTADAAIVAKPGAVSWEEVGVCWFRVSVHGILGYAGTRHVVAHRNPIVDAATVVQELEAWFVEYSERNRSGHVFPQGSIGAIRSGWPNKPTFIPSACEIDIDLRASPRTPTHEVKRQFSEAIDAIRSRHPEISLEWSMRLAVPGSHTDPDEPVVRSAIRGWEAANGRKFSPDSAGSGATEANVLRLWGLPTARMGMPPPPSPMRFSGRFSMGEAHQASLNGLIRALVATMLDYSGSSSDEERMGNGS